MPPLPADSIHARACKLKCEKILTRGPTNPHKKLQQKLYSLLVADALPEGRRFSSLPETAGYKVRRGTLSAPFYLQVHELPQGCPC